MLKNNLCLHQTFLFKSHTKHPQEYWLSVWRSLLHVMASIRGQIHILFVALFLFSRPIQGMSVICRKKYLSISEKHRKKLGLDSVWSAEPCSSGFVSQLSYICSSISSDAWQHKGMSLMCFSILCMIVTSPKF